VDQVEKRSIISLLSSSSKDEEDIEVEGVASGKMWTYKTCWGVAATRKEIDGRKVITLTIKAASGGRAWKSLRPAGRG
jgi:hypothetical protein